MAPKGKGKGKAVNAFNALAIEDDADVDGGEAAETAEDAAKKDEASKAKIELAVNLLVTSAAVHFDLAEQKRKVIEDKEEVVSAKDILNKARAVQELVITRLVKESEILSQAEEAGEKVNAPEALEKAQAGTNTAKIFIQTAKALAQKAEEIAKAAKQIELVELANEIRVARNLVSHSFDLPVTYKKGGRFDPSIPTLRTLPSQLQSAATSENIAWLAAPFVVHAVKEYFYYLVKNEIAGPIQYGNENDSPKLIELLKPVSQQLAEAKELLQPVKRTSQLYNAIKNNGYIALKHADLCEYIGGQAATHAKARKGKFEAWEHENGFGNKNNKRQLVVQHLVEKFKDLSTTWADEIDGLRPNQTIPILQVFVETSKARGNVPEADRIEFIQQLFVVIPIIQILEASIVCSTDKVHKYAPAQHPDLRWFFNVALPEIKSFVQGKHAAGQLEATKAALIANPIFNMD